MTSNIGIFVTQSETNFEMNYFSGEKTLSNEIVDSEGILRKDKVKSAVQEEGHDSIYIDGNANFSLTATQEGWEGNGTQSNPYIIDGLNITGSSTNNDLISIFNTDVHFQIKNCILSHGKYGIFASGVKNGQYFHNYITKTYGTGIRLISSSNNYFENNTIINNYGFGVQFYSSFNCVLANNIFDNNQGTGIFFFRSSINTLYNNTISNGRGYGIFLSNSGFCSLINNQVFNNNGIGILLYAAINNTISNNYLSNNEEVELEVYYSPHNRIINNTLGTLGLFVYGSSFNEYNQEEVANNTINGKLLLYWKSVSDLTVPNGTGQIILVNCSSIIIENQILTNATIGITAAFSYDLNIKKNTISYCHMQGIYFDSVHRSNISENIISYNDMNGIFFYRSNNNTFSENTLSSNLLNGIDITRESHRNIIQRNNFYDNNAFFETQAIDNGVNNTFKYNYWNEWTRPDENNDGIVDTPYQILGIAFNTDPYPMVSLNNPPAPDTTIPMLITRILVSLIPVSLLLILTLKHRKKN